MCIVPFIFQGGEKFHYKNYRCSCGLYLFAALFQSLFELPLIMRNIQWKQITSSFRHFSQFSWYNVVLQGWSDNLNHLVFCCLLWVCCGYFSSFYECLMGHCHWFKCRSMLFQLAPGFCRSHWKRFQSGQNRAFCTLPSSFSKLWSTPFLHHPIYYQYSFHFFTTIADCCSCLNKMEFSHWFKSRVRHHFDWHIFVIWHFPWTTA